MTAVQLLHALIHAELFGGGGAKAISNPDWWTGEVGREWQMLLSDLVRQSGCHSVQNDSVMGDRMNSRVCLHVCMFVIISNLRNTSEPRPQCFRCPRVDGLPDDS